MEKRTSQEIKDFFEKKMIETKISSLFQEACFEYLSDKILNEFDPKDPAKVQNLYYMLEKQLGITDRSVLDDVLQYLVGMKSMEIIGMPYSDIESTVDKSEPSPVEQEEVIEPIVEEAESAQPKPKSTQMIVPEKKRFSFADYAVRSYMQKSAKLEAARNRDMIEGKESGLKTFARGAAGYTLTTMKVATVGTAVLSFRLAKLGVKAFKAAKGTLENAMRKKETRDLIRARTAIERSSLHFSDMSKENMAVLDRASSKYGLDKDPITAEAYRIVKGAEGTTTDIKQDAEEAISEGYYQASENRDNALLMMMNMDIIKTLSGEFGLSNEEALEYLSEISFDEEGILQYPERDDMPRAEVNKKLALKRN